MLAAPRLAAVLVLLLCACASWESTTPTYAAPPVEAPVPSSHYAPPPPVEPGVPTPPPAEPRAEIRVAIASVQLLENCPDPVVAPASESSAATADRYPGATAQRKPTEPQGDYLESARKRCTQSTVQLAVHSDRSGPFRVEAIRVLDPRSKRRAGTTTLRQPTQWSVEGSSYVPWDERVTAGKDLQISFKLGELDLAQASESVGPEFNSLMGPFMLELDVSVGGERQTIRSPEFGRERLEIMVT